MCAHEAITGVLADGGVAAVLQRTTCKSLIVVAHAQVVIIADAPVSFAEVDVLIERALIILNEGPKERICARRRTRCRHHTYARRANNWVRLLAALGVVVEQPEGFVFHQRAARNCPKLPNAEWRLERPPPVQLPLIRVQAIVAVVCKQGTVQVVCARLGHNVDDGASCATVFGAIAVRLHLEFSHRLLAELERDRKSTRLNSSH